LKFRFSAPKADAAPMQTLARKADAAPMPILALRAFAVMLLALMVVAGCGGTPAPSAAQALVGAPAPALSGQGLTSSGSLDLASMKGKPTVVVFWLNSCPHCQAFVPALQAAWPAVADKANILLVGMPHPDPSAQTTPGFETPQAFVQKTGLTLPTILGDFPTEATTWGFDTVPMVYVLGADHIVRKVLLAPEAKAVVDAVSAPAS